MKTVFCFLMLFLVLTAQAVDTKILQAIAHVESRNQTGVIGDLHLKEHSYGKYQIRRIYVQDVMSSYGSEFRKLFHVEQPTMKEIQHNDVMGKWFVTKYLTKYGKYYTKKTGKAPTPEIYFMIHNGGPMGWDKKKKVHKMAYAYAMNALKKYRSV